MHPLVRTVAIVAAATATGPYLVAQQQLAIREAATLYGSPFSAFGNAIASGDVNGDGLPDLLVGARSFLWDDRKDGAVFVHLGNSSGIATIPAWSALPSGADDLLGYAVACLDANADGFSDVVYSAPWGDRIVRMHLGTPAGPSAVPAWIATEPQLEDYGTALASAGDVNGDGFEDLLVSGDVSSVGDAGVVHLFLGEPCGIPAGRAWESRGSAGDLQGYALSGGRDVNGDGYSDLLIGAGRFSGTLSLQGRVLLYLGGPGGPANTADWIYEGQSPNSFVGAAVALIGDINGDGLDELALSEWAGNGKVFVFLGSPDLPGAAPDLVLEGHPGWLEFGVSIAPAGDVNGDGLADILIGSFPTPPYHYAGHVELLLGRSTAPFLVVGWEKYEAQIDALFGLAMCSMGDLNGDGLADFAVGAQGFDLNQENEGRATVFFGSRVVVGGPAVQRKP